MRYLIDTCIFTTYVTDIESLSRDALAIIEDYDNSNHFSCHYGTVTSIVK